jgi:hypothetical protein
MAGNPNPDMTGLRPWRKGQSGNPKGRPVTRPITMRLVKMLEERLPEDIRKKLGLPKKATWADAMIRRAVAEAVTGNIAAMNSIADRVEGSAPRRLELVTPEDKEVKIRIVYEDSSKEDAAKLAKDIDENEKDDD